MVGQCAKRATYPFYSQREIAEGIPPPTGGAAFISIHELQMLSAARMGKEGSMTDGALADTLRKVKRKFDNCPRILL
jgi:hypothetical protein